VGGKLAILVVAALIEINARRALAEAAMIVSPDRWLN
jgi:hypothetical protein